MRWLEWLRDRKNRAAVSAAAGMLACILALGGTGGAKGIDSPGAEPPALCWWGSLYPGFCFSEKPEEIRKEEEKTGKTARPKPSFWLAQVLDW